MIFSVADHIEQIIKGVKTQTRRPTDRYKTFKTYAIQPKRGAKGIPEGRILILRKWKEVNRYGLGKRTWPPIICWNHAQAEGGYAPDNYEALYEEMYPDWKERWAYLFQFVDSQTYSQKEDQT